MNTTANKHNANTFPNGITLTGNGAMCTKEYNNLQSSLHKAHIGTYLEHQHELRRQAAIVRREQERLDREQALEFIE